jgi:rod shape determining protein RodA
LSWNKNFWQSIDFTFILVILLILAMGLPVLKSATVSSSKDPLLYVNKQLMWIAAGLVLACVAAVIDYRKLIKYEPYIYIILVVCLAVVFLIGRSSHGAQKWIPLGSFQFQPSELGKIMLVVCFASRLVKKKSDLHSLKDLLPYFIYLAPPLVLVMLQPDIGTSLVLIVVLFGMLYYAGAHPRLLLEILGGGLGLVILAVALHFSSLHLPIPMKDYQISRLVVFLNPYKDPQGDGFNIIQSMIAVGSGGFWGKGLYHGSQVQLNFLPEHHTDFIFSVVGEELGFLGAAALLFLYYNLVIRTLKVAFETKDQFGGLIAVGIFSFWLFHILENVGMVIGIMPITGIPLPFFSYGGSFMLTNMVAAGLIINVRIREKKLMF